MNNSVVLIRCMNYQLEIPILVKDHKVYSRNGLKHMGLFMV